MRMVWTIDKWNLSLKQLIAHTAKTQSRLRPRSWADSSQSNPNARSWQSFFSRCFRKSMWWKGSFPPKHRQLPCCSFYLGWSINLHPDLVYVTASLHAGLMCSTSHLMEALPRLSQISKTDTLGVPSGQGIRLLWPFDAKEWFVFLAVFCTIEHVRCLLRCPWRISPDIPGLNLDSLCIFCKREENLNVGCPRIRSRGRERNNQTKQNKTFLHFALRFLCNGKESKYYYLYSLIKMETLIALIIVELSCPRMSCRQVFKKPTDQTFTLMRLKWTCMLGTFFFGDFVCNHLELVLECVSTSRPSRTNSTLVDSPARGWALCN